jgi:glutamine---fructose-6-phosphate transaminase (isomerizing)
VRAHQNAGAAAAAHRYAHAEHMFFLGRNHCWPMTREGAQKLKENTARSP